MNSRRQFLQMMGYGSAALYSSQFLIGCGDPANPLSASGIDWPHNNTPPSFPDQSDNPWWIRGNYAPVPDEIFATDLTVLGAIPPEINGVFLRNGPNPTEGVVTGHWFFGDGMLHGVKFENGQALWYRNRWIETYAYTQQARGLLGNRGNTGVAHHAGKTLTFFEGGGSHHVDANDLSTFGSYDFNGDTAGPMSAPPKICPITGEMHTFGYSPLPPYLRYYVINAAGAVIQKEIIDIPRATMMHDFQLTETMTVFYDLPLVFDLSLMNSRPFPIEWTPSHGSRIGLLPRNAPASEIQWIEIDTCFMFHSFNAYDDAQGRVVLEGCRYPAMLDTTSSDLGGKATPWRWTLDPKTGQVTEGAFDDTSVDFPIIDGRRQGLEHRVNYGLQMGPGVGDYPTHAMGLMKHDRLTGNTTIWSPGEAVQPDEPVYVPASATAGEDEGWLLSMVYDHAEDRSEVAILDASNLEAGPVARVQMPRRVPFGFHGAWIPAA